MSLPFYLTEPGPHWYDRAPWWALDLETTNRDKGDPRDDRNRLVVAASSCAEGTAWVIGERDLEDFGREPRILVAHNAKFELGWLQRYGADIKNLLPWDTMIAEYVLAGNRDWDLSLDATAKRYGFPGKASLVDRMMKAGICPSEMPEKWIRERVLSDVIVTLGVARRQYAALKEKGLLPVMFTRCVTTPVLADIETVGMRLDRKRTMDEHLLQAKERLAADGEIAEMTGGINPRSRPQLAAFLYDKLGFEELKDRDGNPVRTKTGLRATDSESLDKLRAVTPEQRKFRKLMEKRNAADFRLVKALDCFRCSIDWHGGLLLGNFNQTVTQTHRLSSSAKRISDGSEGAKDYGAQFQNMPREYKRLFRPHDPANVLTELDYRMLEFMAAVDLSGDKQGMADILSGHDVHKYTASVLLNKPMEEVTKEERQRAKPDTFKPLYYGQSGTPAQKRYYAAFRERYPQIAAMQESWIATAVRTKQQVTASGLIYYWPDARPGATGYVNGSPSICNYPIQAWATADIVPIGLVYLFWRIMGTGDARIINTIHDSIVVEHSPGSTRDLIETARTAMLRDVKSYVRAVYGREITVPLSGEFVTSAHWGDATEEVCSGTITLGD